MILSETGRIAQPSSIVPSNVSQTEDIQELQLLPNEKYEVKRHYDNILRIEPNNLDVLFLRAFHLREEPAAAIVDLDKILQLDPGNSDAQRERNRYQTHQPPETSTSQVTQILNFVQHNFHFNIDIARHKPSSKSVMVVIGGVLAIVAVIAVFDVLNSIIQVVGSTIVRLLQIVEAYFLEILVAMVVLALFWLVYRLVLALLRTRKKGPWKHFTDLISSPFKFVFSKILKRKKKRR